MKKAGLIVFEVICLCIGIVLFVKWSNARMSKELLTDGSITYAAGERVEAGEQIAAGDIFAEKDLQLKKGIYELKVIYNTDTPGNTISLYTMNEGMLPYISSNAAELLPGSRTASLTAWLAGDVDQISATVFYNGMGSITVERFTLSNHGAYERMFLLIFLLMWVIANIIWYLIEKHLEFVKEYAVTAVLLLFMAVIYSLPLFEHYIPTIWGHDIQFHIMRIIGLKNGLLNGQFPVRIQPGWLSGNGYCVSVMYPDLFLHIPAILYMLGIKLQAAYRLFMLLLNVLGCIIAFYSFMQIIKDKTIALTGTFLYTFAAYHFTNVYIRAALGESIAYIFLPLVFCGLYKIATEEETKELKKGSLIAVIGYSGIIQSHVLSCEMVGLFTILFLLFFVRSVLQKKRMLQLLKTVLLTLSLNAFFLIPFLDYYFNEKMQINTGETGTYFIQDSGVFLRQLFAVFMKGSGISLSAAEGISPDEMPLGVGISITAGLLMVLLVLICNRNALKSDTSVKGMLAFFALSIIAMTFTLVYFPWSLLQKQAGMPGKLVSSIQFPWRFLSFASVCAVFAICFSLQQMKRKKYIYPVAIGILVFLCLITYFYTEKTFMETAEIWKPDTENVVNPSDSLLGGEYILGNTDVSGLSNNKYNMSEQMVLIDARKDGLQIWADVINKAGTEGFIEVPLTAYWGYRAMGEDGELQVSDGENHALRISIPGDYQGKMHIQFKEPVYWNLAEVLSVITLMCMIIKLFLNRKIKKIKQGVK